MHITSPPRCAGKSSLKGVVEGWIKDFYSACHLVKRLDRPEGDFWDDVIEKEEVRLSQPSHLTCRQLEPTLEGAFSS